jgi:putative membrane-bound dehydrogenase-like protein
MRPLAVLCVCLALVASVLAAPPQQKSNPGPASAGDGKTPAAPLDVVADRSRIDPPSVDSRTAVDRIDRLPGLTPEEAIKTLAVRHGFQMQLVASEPAVADPVDGAFDEAGRLYVAEFKSYPYSEEIRIPQQPTPIGKHNACLVRRLEDKNGDGVFETSIVFADDLSWVMSVACFDGGVFVLAPAHLYYFKDTDGDGRADERRIVLTGFSRYNVQAAANNMKWTLDNRICVAGGPNGGELEWNGVPIGTLRGQDFLFDAKAILGPVPEEARSATKEKPYRPGWFERIAGAVQFGNSFDDWGNRFLCSNSDHIRHEVFPLTAANRTSGFTPRQMIRSIAADGPAAPVYRTSPPEPWRVVRTKRRISDPATLAKLSESERSVTGGFFTSATGVTIYRGDAYPPEYGGNAFVGDVGGNLIHRKLLEPDGASFVARRADEKVEFVTSTDTWFRPVNFVNGPDGCLYVLDMYRETIEHPYSIPEDIKAHLDLESGSEWGRIWRLAPPGFQHRKVKNLGTHSSSELVPMLDHSNGWHRDTASRLLYERQDATVVPAVRRLLESGTEQACLHALATLNSLGQLESNDVATALRRAFDRGEPHLAAYAVQVGGVVAKRPELVREFISPAINFPNLDRFATFRFRLALAMADWPDDEFLRVFLALAQSTAGKPELQDALMSSVRHRAGAVAEMLLAELARQPDQPSSSGVAVLSQQAVRLAAVRGPDEFTRLVNALASNKLPHDFLNIAVQASLAGLKQRGASLGSILERSDLNAEARTFIEQKLDRAKSTALDASAPAPSRVAAFQLLSHGKPETLIASADEVFSPQAPAALQIAISRAVADSSGTATDKWIVAHWPSSGPTVRTELLDGLMRSTSRTKALLAAVEAGTIKPVELPADRREQLRNHPNAAIREQAAKLFEGASTDRLKIVADYEPALAMGVAERGTAVFKKTCSQCHKVGKEGHQVGPLLVSVKNKSPRDLLLAILDPNREALPQFMTYNVALDDGRVFSGILVGETDSSVTLRRAEAKEDVIPRDQIELLKSTGQSLMPVGLEKDLSPQDVADVIAWIRQLSE